MEICALFFSVFVILKYVQDILGRGGEGWYDRRTVECLLLASHCNSSDTVETKSELTGLVQD
uniref:Uncharacterized protein n=1 Tax=Anguilla anguilla TaxID=7936 RepID=A0A0E9R4W0_ANGAN